MVVEERQSGVASPNGMRRMGAGIVAVKMGQRCLVLLLAVTGLLWGFVLLGPGPAHAFSVFEQKGVHSQEDFLQPDVQSDFLEFGGRTVGRRSGHAEKPDLTKIKKVLEEKRGSRKRGEVRDSEKFYPLRRGCVSTDSCGYTAGGASSTAGVLGTLSEQGLEYVKEVLVGEILEEVTPLRIADIASRVNSPIGRLDVLVSDIVLAGAVVYYSDIDLGDSEITIFAAGVKANLDMRWEYHYTASYVPFPVGDGGRAEVMVSGMQAGVIFTLAEHNGTLGLIVEEAGTYIEDLDIVLHGGASWLYQWFVYAFDYNIRAAIEMALTEQMVTGAEQLDNWLLNLPRAVPIDDMSAIDMTVVHDPLLSPTFLSVGAKGKFVSLDTPKEYPEPDTQLPAGLFCDQSLKMVTIALSDYVLNSAAFVYHDSGELTWDVDNLPGKKYLNTASWRFLIPQLYKKYPNEDMIINFAVSSAPSVGISKSGIQAKAGVDMTIEVKDGEDVVPVACISLMVSLDAVASLNHGNVSGQATLDQLTLALKWSEVGNFPVYLVQATVRTIVKDVVLPLLNLSLKRGFPLPVVAGVEIENADLRYDEGYLLVCSDFHYAGGFFKELKQQKSAPEHWNQ